MSYDTLHALIAEIVQQHIAEIPRPFEGVIVSGSYQQAYGTVSVVKASSAALDPNDEIGPVVIKDIVLLVPAHLQQAGPVGGERCIVFPFHGGLAAHLLHEQDDSPQAPAGEHWIGHSTGSSIKLKNSGDVSEIAQAAHSVAAASSTHTVTGTEAHSSHDLQMTASVSVSITAPSIQIGPSGGPFITIGGGGGSLAIVRVTDLAALLSWASSHTHTGVQGGGGTSGAPTSSAPAVTGSSNAVAS